MPQLTPELYWLTLTVLLTGLMWIPYILQLLGQMGIMTALMDGDHETGHEALWARRAKRAHTNAVENLIVFAPLVLALHALNVHTQTTVLACAVYFWIRLAHYLLYLFGVPVARTLAFFIGWLCQFALGLTLLGWF